MKPLVTLSSMLLAVTTVTAQPLANEYTAYLSQNQAAWVAHTSMALSFSQEGTDSMLKSTFTAKNTWDGLDYNHPDVDMSEYDLVAFDFKAEKAGEVRALVRDNAVLTPEQEVAEGLDYNTTLMFDFRSPSTAMSDSSGSGILPADTTWSMAQSPIYILGDVQLPAGRKLTIEAGVEVRFTGAYKILVEGGVWIEGTEAAPVTFNSASGQSLGACGLKFIGADLGMSSISWLAVQKLQTIIQIGDETEFNQGGKNVGNLTVSHLKANEGLILTKGYNTSASLQLQNIDFEAVTVRGAYPRSEPITMESGIINNSVIDSDSYNKGIKLVSVNVTNSQFKIGCCGANLTLNKCQVMDSSITEYNNNYDITIESSLLVRTPLMLSMANTVKLTDSEFVYNAGGGIVAKNLTMTNSKILNADTGLSVSGSSMIQGSLLTGCKVGVVVAQQSNLTITNTNVFNNSVLNMRHDGASAITATGNYWGFEDAASIENTIQHYVDNVMLGRVDFGGYFSAPVSNTALIPLAQVHKSGAENGVKISWNIPVGDVAGFLIYYNPDVNGNFQTSVDIGLVSSYILMGATLDDIMAVSYYTSTADGQNDLLEGQESWYSFAIVVLPQISVSSQSVDCSLAGVGSIVSRNLIISNPGSTDLTISSLISNHQFFTIAPGPLVVGAGEAKTVTITFSPQSMGAATAQLILNHDAAGGPITINLSGYGVSATEGGTGVSGILPADTTWSMAQSPIYILGDVQLPAGRKLTIEAGVEVRFTGAYKILVEGGVWIEGTEAAPVTFNSASGQSLGACGLKFIGADLGMSSISWLAVQKLQTIIQIGDETEFNQGGKNVGNLTVSHLKANEGLILTKGYNTSASLQLQNIDFEAVTVRGAYPRSEPITMESGIINNSVIDSDSYNKGIKLVSVNVTNSQFKIGCCGANLTLSKCQVMDSSITEYNNNYDITIESSLLVRTPLVLSMANTVKLTDSEFVYNAGAGIVAKNLTMTNSKILNADAGLSVSGSSMIQGSLLTGCKVGVVVAQQSNLTITNTNVFNNSVLNMRHDGASAITATGNYWGFEDAASIENTIQHYVDNVMLGRVDFGGYFSAPVSRILDVSGNLSFGSVAINQTVTQTLTLSNTGTLALTVSSITYPPGFSGDWTSGSIVAGGNQSITVTFNPALAQSYGGTITVNADQTGGTNTLVCSGTGITRIIGLGGNLSFGSIIINQTYTQTFTISNTGTTTLTVSSIAYPIGFSGDWTSGDIPTGATQTVTITFSPTMSQSYSGTITVNSNETSGTNTIAVSGTGIPVPTRIIDLSGDLAFGNLEINSTSTLTMTISNSGNSLLAISSITFPDGFSGNWSSGTIAPSGNQVITVTFSPTVAQSYSGIITVNSDKTNGDNTRACSGVAATFFDPSFTADLGEDWYWNNLFGYFYHGYFPFIYVWDTAEWIYLVGDSETGGYYFYRFNEGHWGWVAPNFYPNYVELPSTIRPWTLVNSP